MVNIHKVYNDGYELINVYTEELYSLVKDNSGVYTLWNCGYEGYLILKQLKLDKNLRKKYLLYKDTDWMKCQSFASEIQNHRLMCCVKHGCKIYNNNNNCPVAKGIVAQNDKCEDCSDKDYKVISRHNKLKKIT